MADWRDPAVPRLARILLRLLGWGTVALIMAAFFHTCSSHRAAQQTQQCLDMPTRAEWGRPRALAAAQQVLACLDRTGPVAVFDRAERDAVRALPSVPCRYVGTWAAFRPGTLWEIELRDDSSFSASATLDGGKRLGGAWGVAGESMVWLYDNRAAWPPDVNPIREQTELGFTLVEANGSTTRFVLVRRPPAPVCKS